VCLLLLSDNDEVWLTTGSTTALLWLWNGDQVWLLLLLLATTAVLWNGDQIWSTLWRVEWLTARWLLLFLVSSAAGTHFCVFIIVFFFVCKCVFVLESTKSLCVVRDLWDTNFVLFLYGKNLPSFCLFVALKLT
jgi:hypothetical protein